MSNFSCHKCGLPQYDSATGYVEGCAHYPPERPCDVMMEFGDGEWVAGVYNGRFAYTQQAIDDGKAVHPVRWKMQ